LFSQINNLEKQLMRTFIEPANISFRDRQIKV
jgi:hypothetical protein